MQKAVRLRAADFDFWGNTPTPEFCENSRERGPRSPGGTAEGFDPPLGAQRNAAARGGGCAGAGRARRKDGGVPRRAGRGRAFAGAACGGRCAVRNGGRFRRGSRGLFARRRAANGARVGLGAWGPQRPRVGRDGAGRARFRAAGRGRYTAAFRGGRGEGAGRGGAIRRAGRV